MYWEIKKTDYQCYKRRCATYLYIFLCIFIDMNIYKKVSERREIFKKSGVAFNIRYLSK